MKKPTPVSEPFSLGAFFALCGGWNRPARVASLSDAALLRLIGAHRFIVDLAVLEAERRGLVPLAENGERRVPDGSFGGWLEVLDMAGADLSRAVGAPLLRDHVPSSEAQIGVVEHVARHNNELRATLRFSTGDAGRSFFADVAHGIRRQVSCGYLVTAWARVGTDRDVPTVRAASWQLLEVSVVALGADPSARTRSLPLPNS
jgi:hypothetical protein